jgi:hypothetical protein
MTENKKLVWLTVIVTGLLVTALFFKSQILSHGFLGFGDSLDGLLAFNIVYHWYNFFHGTEAWQTVGYFYPYVNTLGYNDGYFLYGVFYTFFRAFNINMFLSLELASAAIRLIGFYAFFYLAYRQLHLKCWPSLLGATLFSLSATATVQSSHIQLLSVSFAPLLTVFLIHYFNALLIQQHTARAIFWGCLAGVLYASWLLSAYYMAWFYTFFAVLFLVWMAFYQYRYRFFKLKKPLLWGLLVPLAVTLLALIPFLLTYLPIAMQSGMHTYREVRNYLPRFIDLINVGNNNLIWGKWLAHFDIPAGEELVGFPLIFLAIFIVVVVQVMRSKQDNKFVYLRPLTYAILFSLILTLSVNGKALWRFVWEDFPGAQGLRVITRYWIFLVFPMSVLVGYFFSTHVTKSRITRAAMLLIACLLVLEQISPSYTALNRATEQAFVDASINIPASCRVFYTIGTRYKDISPSLNTDFNFNNVDAMLISEVTGVRTINGTSTFNPPDWNFVYYPQDTYLARINAYLKKHHITQGVCVFDINDMRWYLATAPR